MLGIWEDGTDEPICQTKVDTDIENKCMDTKKGEGGCGKDWERGTDVYTWPCTEQRTGEPCCVMRGLHSTPCGHPGGRGCLCTCS